MSDQTMKTLDLSARKRALLEQLMGEEQAPDPVQGEAGRVIPPRQAGSPAGLSFAQERLWFLDQLAPGTPAYNVPAAAHLVGRLDVGALERSLEAVVARHDVLRSTFPTDGGAVRIRDAGHAAVLPIVDLSMLPPDVREQEVRRLEDAEARRPFHLAIGPLLRTTLLRLGEHDHVLLLTLHHIVCDAWSIGVLLRDLAALYRALTEGGLAPLPDLPLQYADFAEWQRNRLAADTVQLEYWKGHLGAHRAALLPADLPALDLPADRPRPAEQSYAGSIERLVLPGPLVTSLEALGRSEGATSFMTLLAAFQALLYRYTGQEQILVGTPVAGRTRSELEGLIGCFANMLVLRGDVSAEMTFKTLLRRTREVALAAFSHQELPFERLVAELQPERDLSRHPLFQVAIGHQSAPPTIVLPELRIITRYIHTGTSKLDLYLALEETANGLVATLEYNGDLFEPDTIRRMLHAFQVLIDGVVHDPESPIGLLPLLSTAERHTLPGTWSATRRDWESRLGGWQEISLPRLFEAQVERTPDAIAVRGEGAQLTYRELNRRANRLAHALHALGVGPEVLVALCLERTPEMLVALLAILKAGGAYLPLDPAFPRERLALILDDARAPLLLTRRGLAERLPSHGTRVLFLDGDVEAEPASQPSDWTSTVRPEQLAYVIYTSGSTGRPKGVEIEHGALANFLLSMREQPGIGPDDTLLAVTTLSFDIAGLELYLPLIAGARVTIASREDAADGKRLARALEVSGATIMQATPATWQLLLEAGWQGRPSLRILCGGEALPADLARALGARCSELWNLYGPTETTIWSTLHRVQPDDDPVPIGLPIANTRLYLLDPRLQPVPLGLPGELAIGGLGLARGYRNQPALTAERFLLAPGASAQERLYRTGDLVRSRADGTLEYLGRLDQQVKLRGFRVELGEVEAVLRRHPSVRDAVALVACPPGVRTPADRRLIAYVAGDDGPAARDTLRDYLRGQLPDYMVPAMIVVLPELPLTPNGKLDRRALEASHTAEVLFKREGDDRRPARPASGMEQSIATIWQQVLGVDHIGIDDNFFDIGGHSLLLARVRGLLEQQLTLEISMVELFRYPTIGTLAAYVSRRGLEAQGSAEPSSRLHDRAERQIAALASRRDAARSARLRRPTRGSPESRQTEQADG